MPRCVKKDFTRRQSGHQFVVYIVMVSIRSWFDA
jgi:hypothetical protein